MDVKRFNDIRTFSGGEDEWSEWSFVFSVAVNAQSRNAKNLMTQMADTSEDEELNVQEESGLSAELYEILCLKTQGEALRIVRGVDAENGFIAWKKLYNRYNPKTVARAMMDMVKVLTPGKITDIKMLETKILMWEESVRKMERDHGEKFLDPMKMAIMTSICPASIQDVIYQKVDTVKTYIGMKMSVLTLVRNRVAMMGGGAVPMEIGEVFEDWGYDEAIDVDLVDKASVQCHSCGVGVTIPESARPKRERPRVARLHMRRAWARGPTARVTSARVMATSASRRASPRGRATRVLVTIAARSGTRRRSAGGPEL